MRFSRLVASAALVAAMVGLNAAVRADTQVALSGMATAQVFPYGQPQIFQVVGDTHGKKCTFNYSVSLNGTPVGIQGNAPAGYPVSAPLPWNSPDLRLPSSNGGNYSVLVQAANSASNACTGQFTLSFGVVPQTGTLNAVKGSAKVVAVNMPIGFTVTGQSFGTCNYRFGVSRKGTDVGHSTVNQLPFNTSGTYTDPGDYLATADEIDLNGAPDGCTGHPKFAFTVVARPVCAYAVDYYQSPDDSEYGCLHAGVWFSQPDPYTCPSGYAPFTQAGQNTQWGCRQPSKPLLGLNAVNGLLGNAANLNLGPAKATPAPQTATPTIVKVQSVIPASGLWRPNPNVLYAGEHYWANIVGNIPNSGGYNPQLCAYRVVVQNIASDDVATSAEFTEFKTWDIGVVAAPGDYRVVVSAWQAPGGGGTTPCQGAAAIQKVTFLPRAAWVTSMTLKAGAYHFRMADAMGMDQFCQACDSIFSPAHDREFLGIAPTIQGATPGQYPCAYNITQTGNGAAGTMEASYQNGQGSPNDLSFPTSLNPPWWNEFNNGGSTTITVTLTPGNDLLYPPCHVLGGKISKTITFTSNTNAPWVTK